MSPTSSARILQYNLPKSKPSDPVRAIAVARTLTAVRDLDGPRKATLIRYLWEAGLLEGARPIVNIYNAVLTGAVFDNANLNGIALFNQLFLNGVQFIDRTTLIDADLSESHLYEADFATANLTGAHLQGSYPIAANFSGANLQGADLAGADLTGADLTGANLTGADLKGARYNSKPEYVYPPQGKEVVKEPTQWPVSFDPQAEGAYCYDCSGSTK